MQPITQKSTNSTMKRYILAHNIRCIVRELKKRMVVFEPDELVPKMLAVGKSRGTPDFEETVKDLLATLAKKIPSTEYGQHFEKYI